MVERECWKREKDCNADDGKGDLEADEASIYTWAHTIVAAKIWHTICSGLDNDAQGTQMTAPGSVKRHDHVLGRDVSEAKTTNLALLYEVLTLLVRVLGS